MAVYQAALPEADYLVGFVDMLVNDALLQQRRARRAAALGHSRTRRLTGTRRPFRESVKTTDMITAMLVWGSECATTARIGVFNRTFDRVIMALRAQNNRAVCHLPTGSRRAPVRRRSPRPAPETRVVRGYTERVVRSIGAGASR